MRTPPRRRRGHALVVGLTVGVLAYVAVVQFRSEAVVQATLNNESPASLAFLINDLHSSNDKLAAQIKALRSHLSQLGSSQSATQQAALEAEKQQLEVLDGTVPVSGPGVVLTVDAPLSAVDVQDAVNNLLAGGAEALEVNGRRVVTGTPVFQSGQQVSVGGASVGGPWTFTAIGDPNQLQVAAQLMTGSLRKNSQVTSADYRSAQNLLISSVINPPPFLYGTP